MKGIVTKTSLSGKKSCSKKLVLWEVKQTRKGVQYETEFKNEQEKFVRIIGFSDATIRILIASKYFGC